MDFLAHTLEIDKKILRPFYGRPLLDDCYRAFSIRKKNGGKRIIHCPTDELKLVQRKIYEILLKPLPLSPFCHGFRGGFSTLSNATQHVDQQYVLNVDIKDFFPSITAARVKELLMDNLELDILHIDFLTKLITLNGQLPQGAPTSPYIANLVCRKLDINLAELCQNVGASYTRYADDLTFSGDPIVPRLVPTIIQIVKQEGFQVARKKIRVYGKANRQIVTGLVVNSGVVTVPREIRRNLRAAFNNFGKHKQTTWKGKVVNRDFLYGYLSYVRGIHPKFLDHITVHTDTKAESTISNIIMDF